MNTHKMALGLNKEQADKYSLDVINTMTPELWKVGDLIELGSETNWERIKRFITRKPKQLHEVVAIGHRLVKIRPYDSTKVKEIL